MQGAYGIVHHIALHAKFTGQWEIWEWGGVGRRWGQTEPHRARDEVRGAGGGASVGGAVDGFDGPGRTVGVLRGFSMSPSTPV